MDIKIMYHFKIDKISINSLMIIQLKMLDLIIKVIDLKFLLFKSNNLNQQ